jgi:hypothetical protein
LGFGIANFVFEKNIAGQEVEGRRWKVKIRI